MIGTIQKECKFQLATFACQEYLHGLGSYGRSSPSFRHALKPPRSSMNISSCRMTTYPACHIPFIVSLLAWIWLIKQVRSPAHTSSWVWFVFSSMTFLVSIEVESLGNSSSHKQEVLPPWYGRLLATVKFPCQCDSDFYSKISTALLQWPWCPFFSHPSVVLVATWKWSILGTVRLKRPVW